MAVSIVSQWAATAADQDAEILAAPTPGRMLIAPIVTCVIDGSAPTLAIGDVSRNGWTLVSDPIQFASVPHVAGQLQVEVWACPATRYDGWPWQLIYASAMQITAPDVGSLCTNILEVDGLTGQLTVDSVTAFTATNSTNIAMTAPAPTGGANVLQIAAAASNIAYGSYTTTGTGWTQLSNLTTTNPELGLMHAWREATTGGGVTFALLGGAMRNWAGVIVALKTSGTVLAQPNPAWPPTQLQIGLGYDLSTPLSRVRWTDQTSRYLSLTADRGIQAELGAASQGSTTLEIRNDDGAYTPRPIASAATATASGTTTTIKVADASAASIHVADFFRLQYAAGGLKQLDVFQVSSLSSTAGTTTITFKRADSTAGGALTATASGDVYAGIEIDLYIPWRLLKTVAGTPYIVASGWLRDLPVSFTDAHWSEVTASGADALETLTAANPSVLRGEIYRRTSLYAYWPLDDSSGASVAVNASGVSNTALTETVSKYGRGSSTTADFGAASQDVQTDTDTTTSLLGDPGTAWAQDGLTSAEMNAQKGYSLVGSDPTFPPITTGVTILGAIVHTADQINVILGSTSDPTVLMLRNGDPGAGVSAGSIIKLSINRSTLVPIVTCWDKDTHAPTAATAASPQLAGIQWRSWALVFDRTGWTFFLDGVQYNSGSCDLVARFTGIEIGGEASQFYNGKAGPGTHAHIAVFGRKLTAGEIDAIGTTVRFGRTPADSGAGRALRKLNTVGWKGARALNQGGYTMTAEATPSGSVSDIVTELFGYQDGSVFADAANQIQGRTRVREYRQTPRAVLGDGPGELPFQPGQLYDHNPTLLYNDVEVANTSFSGYQNLSESTLIAVDDVSSARYGPRTLSRTTRFTSSYPAWDLAWWLLSRYAYPSLRVGTVTVSAVASNDTASSSGRWAFVCGVEVGDLLTVNRRPIGQPMISVRCKVLRVEIQFDDAKAQVTLTLAAAPARVAVCGDATLGALAGTVLGI